MVSFWIPKTAASSEAAASARRDHEAFMARLVAEKRAVVEHLDSVNVPESGGALIIDAASRADVEAMVGEDPAVKSHAVEFEVLGD
jgi:uncharacterized protein YciI